MGRYLGNTAAITAMYYGSDRRHFVRLRSTIHDAVAFQEHGLLTFKYVNVCGRVIDRALIVKDWYARHFFHDYFLRFPGIAR